MLYLIAPSTASHVNTIVESLVAVAVTTGVANAGTSGSGSGTIGSSPDSSNVVAHALSDLSDSPSLLTAETLKQYSVSASRPFTVYIVDVISDAISSVP